MEDKDRVEQFASVVRPIVTVLFSLAVIVGFLQGKLSSDAFLTIASSAITFWYIQKGQTETMQDVAKATASKPPTSIPPTTENKGT